MPVSVEAVSVEAVSGGDFWAPTPYAKIASPTGDSTTPVQTNQYEIEIASFGERTLLKPAWLAADASSAIFRLLRIRAKPRPRISPPTAISPAFNVDARKERRLKSALCRTVVGFKPPRKGAGEPLSLPEYTITVSYVSEGEVANLIRGYIELKGERIRFSGVAYGRFGGRTSPLNSQKPPGSGWRC